jgi:hypothetical protein
MNNNQRKLLISFSQLVCNLPARSFGLQPSFLYRKNSFKIASKPVSMTKKLKAAKL